MTMSDYISFAGVLIAAITAIGAIVSTRNTRKQVGEASRTAKEAERKSQELAEETARLQALDWTTQYFEGVRAWASTATDTISELIHLAHVENDSERRNHWNSVRARLSALIDQGRWHFPNERENEIGLHKPPAYRGSRQNILDWLVWAYDAYPQPPGHFRTGNGDTLNSNSYDRAVKCQREFVSEIQRVLDPRERESRVAETLEKFRIANSMRDPSDAERKPAG